MLCQGNGATLELEDGFLTIRRRGVSSFLIHGLKGEKRIPLSSVMAVQFKEPGLTTGYLQLTLAGGKESRGGVAAAVKDENTVVFIKKHAAAFREMRTSIEGAIAGRGAAQVPATSSPDLVDQIERLAGLRDRGLLTDAEFHEQKTRLLAVVTT